MKKLEWLVNCHWFRGTMVLPGQCVGRTETIRFMVAINNYNKEISCTFFNNYFQ